MFHKHMSSFCNCMVETAFFSDKIWPTWCLPNRNTSDIIVLALYNVLVMTWWRGGVWGSSPQKIFGSKGVKLCNSRRNKHGNALS